MTVGFKFMDERLLHGRKFSETLPVSQQIKPM